MKKQLLAILSLSAAVLLNAQTPCSELFFSEIVEGSGNDKAMEVYNPTGSSVALSNYRIVRYSNGSPTGTDSLTLNGNLAANDVFVVANGQTTGSASSPACSPALQALADQLGGVYPDPLYQNGDDAFLLVRISPYAIIDIFGKIGEDPGNSWSDVFPYTDAQGTWWTRDHTLQRKASVQTGVTLNPSAFNVTLEYDSLPENTWTGLGTHTCVCAVGVQEQKSDLAKLSLYPNPSNGIVNINGSHDIASVHVYNTVGQLVFEEKYAAASRNKQQVLELNEMGRGLYLVEVVFANNQRLVTKVNLR